MSSLDADVVTAELRAAAAILNECCLWQASKWASEMCKGRALSAPRTISPSGRSTALIAVQALLQMISLRLIPCMPVWGLADDTPETDLSQVTPSPSPHSSPLMCCKLKPGAAAAGQVPLLVSRVAARLCNSSPLPFQHVRVLQELREVHGGGEGQVRR